MARAHPLAETDGAFADAQPRLFAAAYSILGQVMDAEDVVQEAWIRWQQDDRSDITEPLAYLTTVVSRLALDRLKAAVRWREEYVGPWLPEPIVAAADPGAIVAEAEQISMAFLTALERLTPVERVVLVLRDVFDLEYAEIAQVVDKNAVNCRKISQRARHHISVPTRAHPHRGVPLDPARVEALFAKFLVAIGAGNVELVVDVLSADSVLISDGGPNRHAARRPVIGPNRIARLLINLAKRSEPGDSFAITTANGDPAMLLMRAGEPILVMSIEVVEDHIVAIRSVLNPDKLRHLQGSDGLTWVQMSW